MGNFSWVHLILAILIIIFTALGQLSWLVILLAVVIAILSIFGVCSYNKPRSYYNKKEVKPIKVVAKKKK